MSARPSVVADGHFSLLARTPTSWQIRVAVGVVALFALLFALTYLPGAQVRLRHVEVFVPAYAVVTLIDDWLTAYLLFIQFSMFRTRSLVVSASAYLYKGTLMVPWALTFPDLFAPSSLLGGHAQSTAWLYVSWHALFPAFLLAYGVTKRLSKGEHTQGSVRGAILTSAAVVLALVGTDTAVVTIGEHLLPRLCADDLHYLPLFRTILKGEAAFVAVTIAVLWIRRESVLDLSFMVMLAAFLLELLRGSAVNQYRLSAVWYFERLCEAASANIVLFILLYETTTLYAQLVHAIVARRRVRNARLITGDLVSGSLAHEVRQPLAAMTTSASAGLRWLRRDHPDVGEAREALRQVVADGHRAERTLESVRHIFQEATKLRTPLDVRTLVADTLSLWRAELEGQGIRVRTDLHPGLPRVFGDATQLQQVLLNLVANAVDAMSAVEERARLLHVQCARHESGGVVVTVRDSGTGIDVETAEQIFEPLFSTKPSGTGLGLAISRLIVSAHDGRLRFVPESTQGTTFEMVLPLSDLRR